MSEIPKYCSCRGKLMLDLVLMYITDATKSGNETDLVNHYVFYGNNFRFYF